MADLYSVLPGIQVSADEVLEAELLCRQILQAKFPDMDLRDGTGLQDLVIRPGATLLAIINKSAQFLFIQNTIAGINDQTPVEIVDKLLSNWFLTRKIGTQAIINVRLFFARQKEVTITTDTFFSPDNVLKYFPLQTTTISNGNLSFDAFENEYYLDMDLIAQSEGTAYNISSGSLLYFSNFDPFFLHGEINYLRTASTISETNTQFIDRAKTAISTRNLVNNRSIISNLLEKFNLLDGVTPIGFGDAEMLRDQVYAYDPALVPQNVLVHIGGRADIYCRVPLTTGVVQVPTDNTGKAELTGAIYKIKRSSVSGSDVDDTVPFYVTTSVTSLVRSGSTATCTTTSPHGYSTGDSINISGATQSGYNGTFTVTVTGASTFTYTVDSSLVTPATGTITSNKELAYTVTNKYSLNGAITSLTRSGSIATATLANHGYSTGRWVTITGATPSGYNGVVRITGTTQNTFTYTVDAGLTTPATGTIIVSGTEAKNDVAFSHRGVLWVDFGNTQANKTASFEISFFQDLDGVQDYLEDTSNKIAAADYLARGHNLYLLTVGVTAYNGPSPDETTCSDIVKDYLKNLLPGQIFIMSDLVAKLNAGGITTIQNPLSVTYKFYNRDLTAIQTGTITDYFDPDDRTAIFMLEDLTTTTQSI
jgi:hypothetical protein